jgi:hypothetical protein
VIVLASLLLLLLAVLVVLAVLVMVDRWVRRSIIRDLDYLSHHPDREALPDQLALLFGSRRSD